MPVRLAQFAEAEVWPCDWRNRGSRERPNALVLTPRLPHSRPFAVKIRAHSRLRFPESAP
jgi:hypothetical protein